MCFVYVTGNLKIKWRNSDEHGWVSMCTGAEKWLPDRGWPLFPGEQCIQTAVQSPAQGLSLMKVWPDSTIMHLCRNLWTAGYAIQEVLWTAVEPVQEALEGWVWWMMRNQVLSFNILLDWKVNMVKEKFFSWCKTFMKYFSAMESVMTAVDSFIRGLILSLIQFKELTLFKGKYSKRRG